MGRAPIVLIRVVRVSAWWPGWLGMALLLNIDDLIHQRKVEGARIEKTVWSSVKGKRLMRRANIVKSIFAALE